MVLHMVASPRGAWTITQPIRFRHGHDLESNLRMFEPGGVCGRYEIRSLIGEGGMGRVYLAYDAQLQRPVALKVLPAEMRDDIELRGRFEQEARAASALNHPNILT